MKAFAFMLGVLGLAVTCSVICQLKPGREGCIAGGVMILVMVLFIVHVCRTPTK